METHDPIPPAPPLPKKKKKGKTRTHWYSFASRVVAQVVVAQVVGAIVSMTLALFFLQRSQAPEPAGDLDAAFRSMDALAEAGNLPPGLAFDPLFDDLRKDVGETRRILTVSSSRFEVKWSCA